MSNVISTAVSKTLNVVLAKGSATFTNSTNNIALTGIGKDVEVGDVIQISGAANARNNSEFTVEVITNDNNIIVNQAHAGGTTTKSLVSETANVTVKLLCKWYLSKIGLGQGWVNVNASRAANTPYLSQPNRETKVNIRLDPGGAGARTLLVDNIPVSSFSVDGTSSVTFYLETIVPSGSEYEINGAFSDWLELR